ncbi:uroporphyrinogen decarboxylase family protein [Chloroflexota bacterium]
MVKQYTGKERVEALFRREHADRIPVALGLNIHLAPQAGYELNEVRLDPEKAWETFILTEEMLPSDMVRVPADPYLPDVTQARQETTLPPEARRKRRLEDKSSLKTFHYRPPKESRAFATQLEIAKRVISTFPDRAVFSGMGGGPWSIAGQLRGVEQLIYDTVDDPGFVHELMEVATNLSLERSLAVSETGAYVRVGDPSAGCSLISPKMYREFVKPYHEQLFSRLHREANTRIALHICGYVDPIMEDILSLPMDWFELDALSSLEKMVSLSHGKIVIRGQMPAEVFVEGTKEAIEAEVKRCVDTAAGVNPLMLAPGCSIPYNAPVENIKYFLDAAHKYGSYDYITSRG